MILYDTGFEGDCSSPCLAHMSNLIPKCSSRLFIHAHLVAKKCHKNGFITIVSQEYSSFCNTWTAFQCWFDLFQFHPLPTDLDLPAYHMVTTCQYAQCHKCCWETANADNQKMLQIFQSYLESPACESSLPKNSKPSFAHLTASPVEYLFPAVLGALPKAWLSIFKYPLARPGPEICSSPTLPSTTATGRSTSVAPVVQNPRSTARKASGQPMDTTPAAVSFASKVVVSTAASVGP